MYAMQNVIVYVEKPVLDFKISFIDVYESLKKHNCYMGKYVLGCIFILKLLSKVYLQFDLNSKLNCVVQVTALG